MKKGLFQKKIIFGILLSAAMLLSAGCGFQESAGGERAKEPGGEQTTLGRYVEEETDLPIKMEDAVLSKRTDGKLGIINRRGELLISEDNGNTWERDDILWIQEKSESVCLLDVKMSPQGTVGVIYAENNGEEMSCASLGCVLLLPDEMEIDVQFPDAEEDECIDRFWISDGNRYFVSTMEGKIYEVKEDGSSALFLLTEGCPQVIRFQENLMLIDGYDFKTPVLYDMDKKEYVTDEVLDGLPFDSYQEKGMLCNLEDFTDGLGEEEDIAGWTNLSAIADGMERLRRENPGEDLAGFWSEKAVMRIFATISAQEWKRDGVIDRNAIAEFLTQTKRIYEAQRDGLDEESEKRLRKTDEYFEQSLGENWIYDLSNYEYFMNYAAGDSRLFVGVSSSPRSYMELTSVFRAEGFENAKLALLEGAEGGVFIPETVLGIYAATPQKERAEAFIKLFLGNEMQCSVGGYAVNREAFDETLAWNMDGNKEYGKIVVTDEDGREISLEIFPPDDNEIAIIRKWMETARQFYMEEAYPEECVLEEGACFLSGERGLKETLDSIEQKLAIYLAE